MRLLLDSHVALWTLAWPERLRKSTRLSIMSPDNEIFVSAATMWELALKAGKGKLVLPDNFAESLAQQDFKELPVRWIHTKTISRLPSIHGDPFDRLLLAQACAEGLTFVTADQICLQYPVPMMEA
jgi:PIN domain nuclease of toxin-antitoxin system